ncbi:MAG: tetratricopeptide repeat protein [Deltaproteobacteria bacterium]|nr:tetratricopeptide repeat protein [Deltaproteobacteria bacterium]
MKRMAYLPAALLCLLLLPGLSPAQDVQSSIDQGIKHSQAGRYDQALQAFDQALKLKPNDPALITYKATVYYAKGNNAQAVQLCEQAIKLNPSFGRAYYQRGMIFEKQGKYDQAVADLQKAKSLGHGVDPDFIELMKNKAAAKK